MGTKNSAEPSGESANTAATETTTDTNTSSPQQPTENKTQIQFSGEFDKEKAERALAAAREAEKKAKEEARAAKERLTQILKAAGLTADGKTDPEQALKAAIEERDKAVQEAREKAIQLAVYRQAGKAGGDPIALLDSRFFLKLVSEYDPSAADFEDKIVDAIKAAIKENPKLAATQTNAQSSQGTARQGVDHTGGSSKQRPTSLGEAIAAAINRR